LKHNYSIVYKAKEFGLKAIKDFWLSSDDELLSEYNGVGDESLPEAVRDILTKATSFFGDLPFIIHDFEFAKIKPRTKENFHLSNSHLKYNLKQILNHKLPPKKCKKPSWWEFWKFIFHKKRFQRKLYLEQIKFIFFMVEELGWEAFKEAGVE